VNSGAMIGRMTPTLATENTSVFSVAFVGGRFSLRTAKRSALTPTQSQSARTALTNGVVHNVLTGFDTDYQTKEE
jgi:hypothetical protein